jgi:lysozyme
MREVPKDIIVPFLVKEEKAVMRVYDDKRPKVMLKPGDAVQGVLTAGVGHTGPDVQIGMKVDKAQVESWLLEDLSDARKDLYRGLADPTVVEEMTRYQYAALLSFCFNLGAKKSWTIWKRLRAREWDQVPLEMMKFVMWNGEKSQGLVNRRTAEIRLWSTEEPGTVAVTPPSSATRTGDTPPVAADPVPAGKSATVLTAAATVAGSVTVAAKQVQETVAPYADASPVVGQIVVAVATLAAVAAIVVLALTWVHKRKLRG